MADIDSLAMLATASPSITNWALNASGSSEQQPPTMRRLMQQVTGIDARASLPAFVSANETAGMLITTANHCQPSMTLKMARTSGPSKA
jgi:hypothetical protein